MFRVVFLVRIRTLRRLRRSGRVLRRPDTMLIEKKLKAKIYKICVDLKTGYRIERPLLDGVPSLARFFENLTEVTCVKGRVVKFFFTEAVNTVV